MTPRDSPVVAVLLRYHAWPPCHPALLRLTGAHLDARAGLRGGRGGTSVAGNVAGTVAGRAGGGCAVGLRDLGPRRTRTGGPNARRGGAASSRLRLRVRYGVTAAERICKRPITGDYVRCSRTSFANASRAWECARYFAAHLCRSSAPPEVWGPTARPATAPHGRLVS